MGDLTSDDFFCSIAPPQGVFCNCHWSKEYQLPRIQQETLVKCMNQKKKEKILQNFTFIDQHSLISYLSTTTTEDTVTLPQFYFI